jgi:8-oxo-dGTP pyrophosphatase MutT (NUDIX family)
MEKPSFCWCATRKGRWTFPKGAAERELGRQAAAAQEALEEAGALGEIDAKPLCSYLHIKGAGKPAVRRRELVVQAYLCRVLDQVPPEEPYRAPIWFSEAEARQRLCANRPAGGAGELCKVVELAVSQIRASRAELLRHEIS